MSRRRRPKHGENPRQILFDRISELLRLARERMAEEDDPLLIKPQALSTVLILAEKTSFALRKGYTPPRTLLLDVYSFLIGQEFSWRVLDEQWNGEGKLPSRDFAEHMRRISQGVAQRLKRTSEQAKIPDPVNGCATRRSIREVIPDLVKRLESLRLYDAARCFPAWMLHG